MGIKAGATSAEIVDWRMRTAPGGFAQMSAHTKARRSSSVGLVAALVLGSAPAFANDWPSLGLDAGRGRATDEKGGGTFSIAWNASPSAGAFVASPAVVDGLIVVAGAQGDVTALSATDGAQVWTAKAAGGIGASPAIQGGRIYVPSLSGQMQALRLGSGAVAWSRSFGGQNYGSPAFVSDGLGKSLVLAAGFPQQKIVRVSASTGATQWETARDAVAGLVTSSPALGAGQVMFGMNGGRYQTADLLTGATGWKTDLKGAVGLSAPLVVGGTAYFLPGGGATELFAADVASGTVTAGWPVAISDPSAPPASDVATSRHAVSSPSLLGDLIVFVTRFEYDMNPPTYGAPSVHTLREYVVAVDPKTITVAWQQEIGHRDAPTTNDIPELNVSPTPVSFATNGSPVVAVASSIVPAVQVYDLGGKQLWSASLSAPTRSSPVFANGLLVVATDMGVVHAFSADANHAPLAPTSGFEPVEGQMVEDPAPTLKWAAAHDDEGQALRYQVRVVGEGDDFFESPLLQLDANAGETQVAVGGGLLKAGATYRYYVRTRDESGAWSAWSAPHSFIMKIPATISVGDKTFDSVEDAIASLPATGGTIDVGLGGLRVKSPLQLPAGVTLKGSSPQATIIDAAGSKVGVQLMVANRTGAPALQNVTVMGAEVGVQVVDAPNALLRNVVVRDNAKTGVQVDEGAAAEAINVTLAHNGTGASVGGKLSIHSSLVLQNATGLAQIAQGLVTSRYNDVFANTTANYQDVTAGTGDLSVPVSFRSTADLHLVGFQSTTDKGDPADAYGSEPQPNGARVNMGAFGNTVSAELSESTNGWTPVAGARTGLTDPTPGGTPVSGAPAHESGTVPGGGGSGCAVGGAGSPAGALGLLAALGAFVIGRRRRSS
jgi:MYXO-CTERM domain-containing protein